MSNWEDEFDAWEERYEPIKNPFAQKQNGEYVEDKFETYGDELHYVLNVAKTAPARVWTLVDGDDGNLYIVDGYHLVNRMNYFITTHPFEGEFMAVPYVIYEEEDEGNDQDVNEPHPLQTADEEA